jgi:hypothetical protein
MHLMAQKIIWENSDLDSPDLNYDLTLSHSAYFPSTWPKTLRRIWLNLQASLQKFNKNTILVKDIWKITLILYKQQI